MNEIDEALIGTFTEFLQDLKIDYRYENIILRIKHERYKGKFILILEGF